MSELAAYLERNEMFAGFYCTLQKLSMSVPRLRGLAHSTVYRDLFSF
jgi:hypothetical protein